jgi:hypothetical protein
MSLPLSNTESESCIRICCETAVVIIICSINLLLIVSIIGFIYAAIVLLTVPAVVIAYDYIIITWENLADIHEELIIGFYLVCSLLTLIMLLATLKKNNYWQK